MEPIKRKASSVCSLPETNRAKYLRFSLDKDRSGWDKYCFTCHTIETTLFCSKCIRSYHITCIRNMPQVYAAGGFVCSFCADTRITLLEPIELNNALKFLMQRVLADRDFQTLKTLVNCPVQSLRALSNPIDLTVISEKVDKQEYKTHTEFMADILWVEHNCLIISVGDLAKRRILKHFVTFCHNELHDIDICNECYCNANEHPTDWFTKVCEHPHILLWARHGDNYWPAKAMAVRKSDDRIHVRFFGHGCRNAYVEMSECFLYSTKHPKAIDYTRLDSHKDAQREVGEYIQNITQRFGSFRYAGERVWLKPFRAVHQLKAMIPALNVMDKPADRFFNTAPFRMELPTTRRRTASVDFWNGPIYQPKVQLMPIRAMTLIDKNSQNVSSTNADSIAPMKDVRLDVNHNTSGDCVDEGGNKSQSTDVINIVSDSDGSIYGDNAPIVLPKPIELSKDEPSSKSATPNVHHSSASNASANESDIIHVLLDEDDVEFIGTPDNIDHFVEPIEPKQASSSDDNIDNSVGTPSTTDGDRQGTTEVDSPKSKAIDALTQRAVVQDRQSFLTMITANFDMFEGQLLERDNRIRSLEQENNELKKLHERESVISNTRMKAENEKLTKKLAEMKQNYKSVLKSFRDMKRIQDDIIESCGHIKTQEDAIRKKHDTVISKAKVEQRKLMMKLAVAWGRPAN